MSVRKQDEVSERFRLLHNGELCDWHRSPDIVRTVKCILWWIGETEFWFGKRPLGRPRKALRWIIRSLLVRIGDGWHRFVSIGGVWY